MPFLRKWGRINMACSVPRRSPAGNSWPGATLSEIEQFFGSYVEHARRTPRAALDAGLGITVKEAQAWCDRALAEVRAFQPWWDEKARETGLYHAEVREHAANDVLRELQEAIRAAYSINTTGAAAKLRFALANMFMSDDDGNDHVAAQDVLAYPPSPVGLFFVPGAQGRDSLLE